MAEEERRRRSENRASAGALAAGIAHEVRNPLNAISLAAQRIERKHAGEEDCAGFARRIREEVRRLETIVAGTLDLARPATGERLPCDLTRVAEEVVALIEVESTARGIDIELRRPDRPVTATIDREAVRRAIVNLVRNALQASPRGSSVRVSVDRQAELGRVTVEDRGDGVDPAFAERAFDAFVTGRADGVGLGLAQVRRVAEEHGGWARLAPAERGGSIATLEVRADLPEDEPR